MANLRASYSFTIQDYLGTKTAFDLWFSIADTATLATLDTLANGLQELIDPLIDGEIIRSRLVVGNTLSGDIKTVPVEGNPVEQTALFNYLQASVPYRYGVDLPSISNDVLVDGRINLANAGVDAFTAYLIGTHSGALSVSDYNNALTELADAVLTFRKHRKQLNRTSFEVPAP